MDCIRFVLGAGVLAAGITLASAQSYPGKPIRFIAPFPPAGSSDLIIRILSQRMSGELGQPVVVENRPGAGGSLGDTIAKIIPEPQSKERYAAFGVEPLNLQPSQLTEFVRSELAQYGRIVKELGIAAQ